MKINKHTANAIRKRNLAWIGRYYGRSREAVRQWVRDQRIPDHIVTPDENSGIKGIGELLDIKVK